MEQHGERWDGSCRSTSLSSEAFDDLVPLHSPVLHAYFARRAGTAADDLHAELWLVAYASRARYDPELGSVRAWLLGIARNLLLQHYRRAAREIPGQVSDQADDGLDWAAIDARLDAAAVRPALRAALAELAPQERELLLYAAWNELTPTEVAKVMGIPPATARTRLHRLRRRLRERLARVDQVVSEEGRSPL